LSTQVGGSVPNGGAEAWLELQKALNIIGDYRLSSSASSLRWAIPPQAGPKLPNFDYREAIVGFSTNGHPLYKTLENASATAGTAACGNAGSCVFAMATDLETSNGVEISGLNAEEQVSVFF
jgi:hypothetical protein